MEYATRDQLTARDGLAEDDVLTSRGYVRVRGLNRFETLAVSGMEKTHQRERLMLSLAMVNPTLNEDEAASWMRAARGGDVEDVSNKIARLSGMMAEAPKEAMAELLNEGEAEFRDVPSGEAG